MRVRLGPLSRALAAFVAIGALVGGVPYVLVRFVGWPLPRHVPSPHMVWSALSQHGISNTALIDILAIALWIAWAVLALAFVVEGLALVASREPGRVLVAGHLQPIAGALLGALVLSLAASFARSGTSGVAMPCAAITVPIRSPEVNGAPPIAAPFTDVRLVADVHLGNGVPRASDEPVGEARSSSARTYVVKDDDTLWGIAATELGDAGDWREIFDLNRGVGQPGGGALENPHWIYPGWVLKLPTRAEDASEPPTTTEHVASRVPSVASTTPPSVATPRTNLPPTTRSVPTTTVPETHPAIPTRATGPDRTAAATNGVGGSSDERIVHDNAGSTRAPAPVRLPSGALVGGTFALGALGALALARLRRRHTYRYRPPQPGRRLSAEPLGPALRTLVDAVQAPTDEPVNIAPVIAAVPADDDADHRERPDFIEIGTREEREVSAFLSELAGICLVGDNADWVTRQLLCELLIRSGPLAAEICATETAIERLFPGFGATLAGGRVPGVRVVAGGEAICSLLEGEVAARTRQFAVDEAPDVLAYRRAYSWDPMPTVIALVDEVSEETSDRWRAIFGEGPRLGLGAIVLDACERGERRVELTGWLVTAFDPALSVLKDVDCFGIGPNEANEILKLHTEVEERPTSEDGISARRLDDGGDSQAAAVSVEGDDEPWPDLSPQLDADGPAPEERALAESDVVETGDSNADDSNGEVLPTGGATVRAPIAVRVFGPYEIAVNGRVLGTGVRLVARELLAWLLLRPEGASIGAAIEALWPDTDPAGVSNKFWRAASDLRTEIGATATPSSKLVKQAGDVYLLDREAIDCDLWRFQAALRTASRAEGPEEGRQALREAVDCYGGEFLDGMDWFWVPPVREDLHRRALDAHVRLAELESELDNPAGAEVALEAAIEFDRYAEEPYRRLMTFQAERDRLDAVAATWRRLERRLAEIDVDPEQATLRCYRNLTAPSPAASKDVAGSVRRLRKTS